MMVFLLFGSRNVAFISNCTLETYFFSTIFLISRIIFHDTMLSKLLDLVSCEKQTCVIKTLRYLITSKHEEQQIRSEYIYYHLIFVPAQIESSFTFTPSGKVAFGYDVSETQKQTASIHSSYVSQLKNDNYYFL